LGLSVFVFMTTIALLLLQRGFAPALRASGRETGRSHQSAPDGWAAEPQMLGHAGIGAV
jgi:hypothetical protein